MGAPTTEKSIAWLMVISIQALSTILLVLVFIIMEICRKPRKREHVQVGVKEKPKKSKKVDKAKVAYKKW